MEHRSDFSDVKVIIGKKVYNPNYFDWVSSVGDYPELTVDVSVCPHNEHHTLSSVYKDAYLLNKTPSKPTLPTIKNVIFNEPATIVFWSDNTKTVVKCDGEEYDPEKGIAMAISRKMIGDNKQTYYNIFRHWLKKYEKQQKTYEELKARFADVLNKSYWDGNFANF